MSLLPEKLAKALKTNSSLTSLNLDGNQIPEKMIHKINRLLLKNLMLKIAEQEDVEKVKELLDRGVTIQFQRIEICGM